jgi:hypothetical protein
LPPQTRSFLKPQPKQKMSNTVRNRLQIRGPEETLNRFVEECVVHEPARQIEWWGIYPLFFDPETHREYKKTGPGRFEDTVDLSLYRGDPENLVPAVHGPCDNLDLAAIVPLPEGVKVDARVFWGTGYNAENGALERESPDTLNIYFDTLVTAPKAAMAQVCERYPDLHGGEHAYVVEEIDSWGSFELGKGYVFHEMSGNLDGLCEHEDILSSLMRNLLYRMCYSKAHGVSVDNVARQFLEERGLDEDAIKERIASYTTDIEQIEGIKL